MLCGCGLSGSDLLSLSFNPFSRTVRAFGRPFLERILAESSVTPVWLIDHCRRLLDIAIGVINAFWHPVVADREIDETALRLRSPIAVGRHLDFAHRVGFASHSGRTNADRDVVRLGMGPVVHVIAPPAPSGAAQCSFTGGPVRGDRPRASKPSTARRVPCNARSCSMRSERYITPANRPSMKKPRPKRRPIKFPTVSCWPRDTSEPKSRYV